MQLYTIGHSNHSAEEFLSLLEEFKIRAIADVRRFPSSRKFPHFNGEALREMLEERGIGYEWFEELGGHRHGKADERSPNTAFMSAGFRNYADYMMTAAFREAVTKLIDLGNRKRTAIMCAEKYFWKCHRRLLSDYLVAHHAAVMHVLDHDSVRNHSLTKGAVITEARVVIYPRIH